MDKLIEKIKGKEFGLQLNKATDSNKDAHLIFYARFMDNITNDDALFCNSIIGSAKALYFFEILDRFIAKMIWIGLVFVLVELNQCLASIEEEQTLMRT